MKKNKKFLILIPIFILIILIIGSFFWNKEEKFEDPLDSLLSYDDFNKNVDIIIDKTDKIDLGKIEINDNLNEFEIGDAYLTIDTGNNLILSNSYIDISENYSILEVLIGLDGNKGYLNDAQLSTSYDFANQYSKKWYLIDKRDNSKYLILETKGYELILNTTLEGEYIICNLMSCTGNSNIADKLTIPIEDIIDTAISNEKLNYTLYSIYNNQAIPSFESKDIVKMIKTKEMNLYIDLDGDSKADDISIDFFNGENTKNDGVSITINEVSKDFIVSGDCNFVRIIDLDKSDNLKELIFIGEDKSINYFEVLIVAYDGEKLIRTFKGNSYMEIFELGEAKEDFEFCELELTDGKLRTDYDTEDAIQKWKLDIELKLNEDHKLTFFKNEKGYFDSLIERTITSELDIVLYEEMNYESNKITIPKKTPMNLIGTTLDYWGVIEYEDKLYYLPIGEDGMIKDLYTRCSEIFDGLAIYD